MLTNLAEKSKKADNVSNVKQIYWSTSSIKSSNIEEWAHVVQYCRKTNFSFFGVWTFTTYPFQKATCNAIQLIKLLISHYPQVWENHNEKHIEDIAVLSGKKGIYSSHNPKSKTLKGALEISKGQTNRETDRYFASKHQKLKYAFPLQADAARSILQSTYASLISLN